MKILDYNYPLNIRICNKPPVRLKSRVVVHLQITLSSVGHYWTVIKSAIHLWADIGPILFAGWVLTGSCIRTESAFCTQICFVVFWIAHVSSDFVWILSGIITKQHWYIQRIANLTYITTERTIGVIM